MSESFSWVDGSTPMQTVVSPLPKIQKLTYVTSSSLLNPAKWLRLQYYNGCPPAPDFEMIVVGSPAPQGSKVPGKRLANGRIPMRESSKRVAPWRDDISKIALNIVSPDGGKTLYDNFPLTGPLVGEMIFTMSKPTAAPKKRRTYAATRGNDVSKIIRSTEDALVKVRALDDDGLIIEYLRVGKVFPGEDDDALSMPGAVIRFWAVNRLPELGAKA